jgi:hypothetical protein
MADDHYYFVGSSIEDQKGWAVCLFTAAYIAATPEPTSHVTIYSSNRRYAKRLGNVVRALVGAFFPNVMLIVEYDGGIATVRKVGYMNKHLLCLYFFDRYDKRRGGGKSFMPETNSSDMWCM